MMKNSILLLCLFAWVFNLHADEKTHIIFSANQGSDLSPVDVARFQQRLMAHLQSCSFDCTEAWGSKKWWDEGKTNDHILVQYKNTITVKTVDDRTVEIDELLVPLHRDGWRYTLARHKDRYSCNTKCSPETSIKVVCNRNAGVYNKGWYKQFCNANDQ